MNPKAAQMAMEQMGRMTPEQMAKLQQQMGNITPDMMQAAMNRMGTMTDNDWDNMNQRVKSMDPSVFTDGSSNVASQFEAHQQYVYKGSLQLKEEGNKLHKSGNYTSAIEKYSRAKNNLQQLSGTDAGKLKQICSLNLASCHLNLNQHQECIKECTDVIQDDSRNVKALYRRGQGYKGLGKLQLAKVDLEKALQLSAGDKDQADMIKQKLTSVEEALGKEDAIEAEDVVVEEIRNETASTFARPSDSGPVIEEITEEEARHISEGGQSQGASSSSTSFPTDLPTASPERMRQTAEMIQQNPDILKQAAQAMADMPDEDLVRMGKSTGLNMSPDMVRAAQKTMTEMDPETFKMMANMAGNLPHGRSNGDSTASPSGGFKQSPSSPEAVADMYRTNPELIKQQAEMLSKIPQEELDRLARQSGVPPGFKITPEMAENAAKSFSQMDPERMGELAKMAAESSHVRKPQESRATETVDSTTMSRSVDSEASTNGASAQSNMPTSAMGGMPAFSPEMMKAATEMMSQLSPEEMAEMTKMAATMGMEGGPNGGGGVGGAAATPSFSSVASNPTMVRSMFKMMKNMDEDTMANMCMSSGMCPDESQARQMAKTFSKMSEGQVEMMVKAASVVQSGATAVKKTKDFLKGRVALVLAILMIIIGILLRYMGWM